MEGNYGVYFGNQIAGKVQVTRQGLYYRFHCRCQLNGGVVCRLCVSCGDRKENLGVVVPMDGGFGLDTKLPAKRIGEGKLDFSLIPKHAVSDGQFAPVYPEEPFAYIARLKDAYLEKRNGQVGVAFR